MSSTLTERRVAAIPKGLTVMSDIFVDHAVNAEIWDVEGNRYIDFATGTSTLNVGHSHPKIIDALHKQVDRFTHTFFQQLPYESYVQITERLNQLVPGDFTKKTALFTDGAGAVENALKIAKAYTKRSGIISFNGGFHGRTLFTSSIAGKVAPYKNNLGSPVGEVYQIPFPSNIDNVTLDDTKQALGQLFKYVVDPNRIAAIIVEPIQGEGGFRPATAQLMQYIRNICNEHNIVMIADEVQSGFGRTGKLFAMEHFDVCADITVMSKSIAAGIPMSAVTGRVDIMDSPEAGGLGGTYNGNPLGCVAANMVLDIIEEEKLLSRATMLGNVLQDFLHNLQKEYPHIADVRGLGAMFAVEICNKGVPDIALTKAIQKHARDTGLILITAGVNSNVIRFLYPLTIPESVFNEALEIFSKAVKETCH